MKKILGYSLVITGVLAASAAAQDGFNSSISSEWSPYDTIYCLGIECGVDLFSDSQLMTSIDFFNLDYFKAPNNSDVYNGLVEWHHRSQEEIQICTSTCYSHYVESKDACTKEAPTDGTFYGNFSGAPDEVALSVCLKAIRETLYRCIPGCN